MDPEPRDLLLLRIDDRTSALPPLSRLSATADEAQPPKGLSLLTFGEGGTEYLGIDGWERAIRFWSAFAGSSRLPDLVVADVRFDEDRTSPLNFNVYHPHIPTGLSHLKPIAALARALQRPLGVAIYTGQIETWPQLAGQGDRMGLLAAHEIGELSAILGDGLPLHELTDLDSRMEWCWQWLRDHSKRDFMPAVEVALEDYRRRLIKMATPRETPGGSPLVGVLPSEYARLLAWCERGSRAVGEAPTGETYLEIVVGNTRERIRMRSLFADGRAGERRPPPACFLIPSADAPISSPWKLGERRLPQFGAFVSVLGSLSAVFDEARAKVAHFGFDRGGRARLTKVTTDPLARGLVILFQLLRRDYRNFREWEDLFSRGEWNAKALTISSSADGITLENTLDRILYFLRTWDEEAWSFLDEVAEDIGIPSQALRWHLALLVEEGAVLQREEDFGTVYRFERARQSTPPVPSVGPSGFNRIGPHLRSFLRDSLGISKKNDNQIGLSLNAAFVQASGSLSEQARAGRQWLDAFLSGNGSAWLVHTCQQYAREELAWSEESAWPQYIRLREPVGS